MSLEALLQRAEVYDGIGIGGEVITTHQPVPEAATINVARPTWHHTPDQIASALFRISCRASYSGHGPYPDQIMERLLR